MTRIGTAADAPAASDARLDTDLDGGDSDGLDDDELDSDHLRRHLTTRAGEVAAAERERALRAFDDAAARRVLSTMAVRLAVRVVEPAVVAAETDDGAEAVVTELFLGE